MTTNTITMLRTVLVAFLCAALQLHCEARPQELLQPKWNWEAVILSRNGPSTSTTPRPSTTWSTTTLRSFDVDPIVGRGQGIVEDARLVPRGRQQQNDLPGPDSTGPNNSAPLSVTCPSFFNLTVSVLVSLTLMRLTVA